MCIYIVVFVEQQINTTARLLEIREPTHRERDGSQKMPRLCSTAYRYLVLGVLWLPRPDTNSSEDGWVRVWQDAPNMGWNGTGGGVLRPGLP